MHEVGLIHQSSISLKQDGSNSNSYENPEFDFFTWRIKYTSHLT